MKKYTASFAVAYLILTVAVAALFGSKGSSGLSIAATIGASFLAAWLFTKDHGREPTAEEKGTYAWQALLCSWGISLILVAGVLAATLTPRESKNLLAFAATEFFLIVGFLAAILISAIYYAAIRWSFSWYAKLACKSIKPIRRG